MFSEYFGSKKQINPSSKVSTSKISHAVEGSTSPKLKPSLTKYSSAISSKRPKLNLRSKRLDSQDASVCNENTAHGSPKVKILIDAIPEKTIKVKQTPFFPDKQPYTINRSLSPVFQFTGIKKKVEPLTYKNADDHKKSLTGISNHLKNTIADKSKISVSAGKSSIIPEQKIETGEELLEAVKRSHFDKVLNILSRNDDLSDIINIRGENSWAPMHFACWIGNLNIVNLLYYNQADINAVARGGITPVMVCCIKGGIKLLNHLISMRVCLDQTDENGNNVLHFAAKSGCVECVRALINSHKVDILLKNSEGKAPIDLVKTADQRKALVDACNQSDEYNQERLIQIASVKNENFLMLDSDKRLIRTAETDSTSRSRDVEEVGPKDFVIHAQIGRGSFGEVYLVEKKATGMLYAMKILYKNKMAQQNLLKYAQTERNVLSLMKDHPFIVTLHFAFQTSEKLFLILEYCPGGDMAKLLKEKQRISEDIARIYIAEILLSLQRLHTHNIIYRDLKPDNVVFDSKGHAMLTDFGLSKEGVNDYNQGAKTFCGSVAYIAPEVLQRTGHGKAVDWYLLGVLLYEMLVGVPPHFAKSPNEIFEKIANSSVMVPTKLSEEAKSLLYNLLQTDPSKRLGSDEEDAEAIKRHPFFAKLDWDKVYRKQLSPPLPKMKKLIPYLFSDEVLQEARTTSQNEYMDNWSFIVDGI